MGIFEKLQKTAIDEAKHYPDDLFILRGLWRLDIRFKPNPTERLFSYTTVIAQTIGQGCCYCPHGHIPILNDELIGNDARYISAGDRSIDIAILDAIYFVFNKTPQKTYTIHGNSNEKAVARANIIVNEVLSLLKDCTPKSERPSVLNIGVVGNIIQILKSNNIDVYATDLDDNLVGRILYGVKVQDESMNKELMEQCDIALVTGMSLSTKTIDMILEAGKENQTKIILFAETGFNFAEEYCKNGIDVVISEPFPFYIFQGMTEINIYRAKDKH